MARSFLLSLLMAGLLSGATLLGACFDKPAPACAFWCGVQGACPDGYRCAEDLWCKREDVPESQECGPGPIDAAPGPADAAPEADGAPDAPDAGDAGIPDAGDAPDPSDAAISDARPADAAPAPAIDAAQPDANGAGLR